MKINKGKSYILIFLLLGLFAGIITSPVSRAALTAAEKMIGDYDGSTFNSQTSFNVGEEATIKITVRGGGGKERQNPDIMLVMDRSGSMGWGWHGRQDYSYPRKIESAKLALLNFVNKADPAFDRLGLSTYADLATLNLGLTTDFEAVRKKIVAIAAVGNTSIGSGMAVANKELIQKARSESPRVMVLATDGQQNTFPSVYEQNILQTALDNKIVVYTIGIGADSEGSSNMSCCPKFCASYCPPDINTGRKYMEDIAAKTGGKYYFAPNEAQLLEIYEQIKEEISYNWRASLKDTLNSPYFSDLKIVKVTDATGNEMSHDLSISGRQLSGDLGNFSAGEERLIYLKVQINQGSGSGPWTVFVDDQSKNNSIEYRDPEGKVVAEEDIGNIEITISRLCDNLPPVVSTLDQCSLTPTWNWPVQVGVDRYHIQIATEGTFGNIIEEDGSLPTTSYTFSDPNYRGSTLFLRTKAHNTCDEWSDWSSTSGDLAPIKFDKTLDNISNPVSVQPLDTSLGTVDRDVTVVFESASSGTVTFTYIITRASGSNEPYSHTRAFTWSPGDSFARSESHTFPSLTLNPGDSVGASALVEAHNSPPTPSCGVDSDAQGIVVSVPDWLQVINGDVYSNYNPSPPSGNAGVAFYVYDSPPNYEAYFLAAEPNLFGGIIQARQGIECPSCNSFDMINERRWNLDDYLQPQPEGVGWPTQILLDFMAAIPDGTCRDVTTALGRVAQLCHFSSLSIPSPAGGTFDPTLDFPRIVVIDGELEINGNLVSGPIYGIYFANKIEISGTRLTSLEIVGALFAQGLGVGGGFFLENIELINNQDPAVAVNYNPEYFFFSIPILSRGEYSWKEVKPL